MRRVLQKTVTTTKIISLTITSSEEEVHYALTNGADQLNELMLASPAEPAPAPVLEPECDEVDDESSGVAADTGNSYSGAYVPDGSSNPPE